MFADLEALYGKVSLPVQTRGEDVNRFVNFERIDETFSVNSSVSRWLWFIATFAPSFTIQGIYGRLDWKNPHKGMYEAQNAVILEHSTPEYRMKRLLSEYRSGLVDEDCFVERALQIARE